MAFEVNSVPLSETIMPGLPRRCDQRRQLARHPPARDRGVGDRRQAFARHVVDDVEDAEPPAVGELVMDEVQRPARIRPRLDQDRRPRSNGPAAGAPLAHRKPFLAIEPVDAVDARGLALLPQQDEQPPIAKAPALVGEIAQLLAQLRVRRPARTGSGPSCGPR